MRANRSCCVHGPVLSMLMFLLASRAGAQQAPRTDPTDGKSIYMSNSLLNYNVLGCCDVRSSIGSSNRSSSSPQKTEESTAPLCSLHFISTLRFARGTGLLGSFARAVKNWFGVCWSIIFATSSRSLLPLLCSSSSIFKQAS